MKLTALGSGAAFVVGVDNYQSNFLLETDSGQRLMIDCGADARHALHRQNLAAGNINALYITHLHSDHVGGLEWLGFSTYFNPDCPRPRLYLNEAFGDDLWTHVLSGGMRAVPGDSVTLETFFEVERVRAGQSFTWTDAQLTPVPVRHVEGARGPEPAFGLRLDWGGACVLITGDTMFLPEELMDHYRAADLILHDCETALPRTGVHAHWRELQSLPPEIRSRTWLYHYNPLRMPDAQAAGFAGFLMRGQCFTLAELARDGG